MSLSNADEYFYFVFSGLIGCDATGVTYPMPSNTWDVALSEDRLKATISTNLAALSPRYKYQFQLLTSESDGYSTPEVFSVEVSWENWTQNLYYGSPIVNNELSAAFTPPGDQVNLSLSILRSDLQDYVLALNSIILIETTPYVLFVNIGAWDNVFVTKTYDSVAYNTNVLLNQEYLINQVLNANQTSVFYRNPQENNVSGFETGNGRSTVGYRLLELTCLKMFRNARSRYPIKDIDFVSLYESIGGQIQSAFSSIEVLDAYSGNAARYVENSACETLISLV